MQTSKVKGRSVGSEKAIEGPYDDDPMLNSLLYDIKFPNS